MSSLFLAGLPQVSLASTQASCTPGVLPPVCSVLLKQGEPPGNLDGVSPLRRSIIAAADAEVGRVDVLQDSSCFKKGWDQLAEFYTVSWMRPLSEAELAILKRPLHAVGDQVEINSWCGIFALWAAKTGSEQCISKSGAEGCRSESDLATTHWVNGVGIRGLKLVTGTQGIQPGDIALYSGGLQHHAIVERVIGNQVYSIDGNEACELIARRVRPLSQVLGYYRVE
jgi:hypothetical protein